MMDSTRTRGNALSLREPKKGTIKDVKSQRSALGDIKNKLAEPKDEDPVSPMETSGDVTEAFSSKNLPDNVQDIDSEDSENPQLVSEYVNDIYQYLTFLEKKYTIKQKYLSGQLEISGRMRAVLVDWLIQVHSRFSLLQETLYLTIAVIDRFLQEQKIARSKLQLLGVTAMFIASKYEEMYSPEIGDFVYITDNTYSKQEILRMEEVVLKTLGFSLGRPLPLHFLRRYSKAGNVNVTTHTVAKYLMELTLPEYDFVQYSPSHLAAAALCLSMKLILKESWSDTLIHYSQYKEEELLPLITQLCKLILKADSSKTQAVRTKYASGKLMSVSRSMELKSSLVIKLAQS